LSGTTLQFDSGNHALRWPPAAARRISTWRRKLPIGLALAAIAFLAVAKYVRSDMADPGKRAFVATLDGGIVSALKDPLALLDERSPGRRGPGVLHLTKSGTGPHERVLADVRQREPGSDLAPGAGPVAIVDIAPAAVAPLAAPPRDSTGTGGNGYLMPGIIGAPFGYPGSGAFFGVGPAVYGTPAGTTGNPISSNSPTGTAGNPNSPNSPPGSAGNPSSPNSPPGSAGNPSSPSSPPGNGGNPESPNSPPGNGGNPDNPISPPGSPDNPISPPGNPDNPISPPGSPDNPISPPDNPDNSPGSGPPTTIPIPEPATWLLMTLGLIVLLVMHRTGPGRTD
jgi:PEP-CTERM motif